MLRRRVLLVEVKKGDVLYVRGSKFERAVVKSIEQNSVATDKAIPGGGVYGIDMGIKVNPGNQLMSLPSNCASIETILLVALQQRPQEM